MSENQSPSAEVYGQFVRKLFNRSGDPSKDFTHAVLGIVTETHEYLSAEDEVNALEELGDLEFFGAALYQVVFDRVGEFDTSPVVELGGMVIAARETNPAVAIANTANDLLDHAKRWVGYGKEPADVAQVYRQAAALVAFANSFGAYPNRDVDRIRAANMRKLLTRYPGGEFDAFRAVTRDLEAERGVLQAS